VTVIAAVPTDECVFMASDTAIVRRDTFVGTVAKILRPGLGPEFEQQVLLGIAGSRALHDAARLDFCERLNMPNLSDLQDPNKADLWAHAVALRLCKLAVNAEPPLLVDDGECDAEALLAVGPHMWLLSGQSAVPLSTPFAIGSGSCEARGALVAADELGLVESDPLRAAELAVMAAIQLDAHCGGSIDVADTQISRLPPSSKINRGGDPLSGPN